jgi:hypothetical protein
MMRFFTLIILSVWLLSIAQSQTAGFSSVKIGMKDDRVEKLAGLPMEIFKGFPDFTGSDVEVKGQLNYVCWRYKNSKRITIDTVTEDITEERNVIDSYDTVLIINGWKKLRPWETSRIYEDTVYTYREHITSSIITKEDYDRAMLYSSEKDKYDIIQITSKEKTVDTVYIFKPVVVGTKRYKRSLLLNKCILFDPSSNRVVSIDFYPTTFETEIIQQKNK